ncbi:MAG TPA: sulfotransferase [Candidatus Limnocylindria bacterium]|nr:sulfotransferase [Candidatus Limnocylindria bacterium]
MKRPDLFIVGAFKAGTTSMYEYLRAHPQIFMSVPKEPTYFGADLSARYRRMSEDEYLALFRGARPEQRAGEATPWYLYSTSAAAEIKAFEPAARIVIMLRNPVDVMFSQHGQLLFNQREDLPDFGSALDAEPDRIAGRRIPAGAIRPESLFYRKSVRFPEQVRRYLEVFGRDGVHFIVFEDLVADAAGVYRSTLEFLGVDSSQPLDRTVYNANRGVRSGAIQRAIFAPPPALRGLYGRLRQFPLLHRVRDRLVNANSRQAERAQMDPALRALLTAEFAPQVAELGDIIGRDLSAWSRA